jgi:L-rhamnose isomerase
MDVSRSLMSCIHNPWLKVSDAERISMMCITTGTVIQAICSNVWQSRKNGRCMLL